MATVTLDAESPGKARFGPVFGNTPRTLKLVTGQFSFDNSYPTGGEDISDIFNQFTTLLGLRVEDPLLSAGTGKRVVVDYTNKKLKLVDNAVATAEVANTSDQSGAANLRFYSWGY